MQVGDGGEVPIGAVMVHEGRVVSLAGNAMEGSGDPTQHAELLAIQDTVRKLGRHRMLDCTMYVTLEPCPMCAGALLQARVGSLVYAAKNPLLGDTQRLQPGWFALGPWRKGLQGICMTRYPAAASIMCLDGNCCPVPCCFH
jgi:tRNA(Arg) A34 adenosine deaminase TadA